MKKMWDKIGWVLMTIVGSAIFGARHYPEIKNEKQEG